MSVRIVARESMSQRPDEAINILLVEDNPGDQRLAVEVFKDAKTANRMHVASDGPQALRFLHHEAEFAEAPHADLIILDLNLPGMSGHEVLQAIKSDAMTRTIPVVVLSSSAAEQDVERCYRASANCYIRKPKSLDEYIAAVERIDDFWLSLVTLPGP